MYLYHIAEKDLQKDVGLKIPKSGILDTLILVKSNPHYE